MKSFRSNKKIIKATLWNKERYVLVSFFIGISISLGACKENSNNEVDITEGLIKAVHRYSDEIEAKERVERQKEAELIGTYIIGENYGIMGIYPDKTVRIKIHGGTYAGSVVTGLFGDYDDYVEIDISESIPVKWNGWFWEDAFSLYMDVHKEYLYFSYSAYKAKDENNRWMIRRRNPNDNSSEYPQKKIRVVTDNSESSLYENYGMKMSVNEMIEFGKKYEKGLDCNKDPQKAFYYYQKAAEMGDATGLNKMGNMYSQGIGCERDPATAFYYYKQAAEKGNMYAQFNLANFYWLGSVVEEDRELAIIWFRRSAAQGYTPAKKFLKEMVGEEM